MATGMKVWDESGNLIIALTSRLSRIVGSRLVGATESGSIFLPTAYGALWAFPYNDDPQAYTPIININQSTGEIAFSPNSAYAGGAKAVTILYGIY